MDEHPTTDDDTVIYAADGPIATITMNRPQVLNALDPEGYALLRGAFDRFEADASLRVAILTGAGGRAFSTGSDLRGASWHPGDDQPMAVTEETEPFPLTKPAIAAIDGYCVGGGLEWALRCDLRIATPRSSFGLPEPRWGSLAGYGLHMLSRMIPAGEALYLQLTGERIDAERAYRCCLVQELVEPERLLARAREIAGMILACSPLAVEAIKQTVDFGLRRGVEDSYRFARPLTRRIAGTEDAHEGPRAFAEKRNPVWKGR
jgi:enoyl-CoA hydratase/carnithine racemase